MPDLLRAVSAHLSGLGIVRDPAVTGAAPPLWLEPREGVPAPGEGAVASEVGADAVIGANRGTSIPPSDGEGYSERIPVDFVIRTALAAGVTPIHQALLAEFAPPIYGFRADWVMGGLEIIISRQWRGLSKLSSDEHGWTWTASYLFETFVS